jgi:precorrin-2 dehydrogenase / sirohydrochlorin ferrochelatase
VAGAAPGGGGGGGGGGCCIRLFYPPGDMLDADLYIACLDLTGRRALVVGSGDMATEKVTGLASCGAQVDAIAPAEYSDDKLDGAYLVVAATGDRALDERIFADAESRAMLVNVADVPDLCNFILPAIARRGPLVVAVSTSGASPALAKRMRREAEAMFDTAYARLAEILDGLRPWAKENLPDYAARRDFFEAIVQADPDPVVLLRENREDELMRAIEKLKAHR